MPSSVIQPVLWTSTCTGRPSGQCGWPPQRGCGAHGVAEQAGPSHWKSVMTEPLNKEGSAMLSWKRLKFTFMLLSAHRWISTPHIWMLIFKSLLITSTENGVSNSESPQCWLPEAAQDVKSLSTLFHSNSLGCTLWAEHSILVNGVADAPQCSYIFYVIDSKYFVPGLLGKSTFSILYFIIFSAIQ